jgi:UDP-2,3-diacylglucosamine hydrolase
LKEIKLEPIKKIYFASDFHLGAPNVDESQTRERKIYLWLNQISVDAQAIFFVGDIFDFWFEYKSVIPQGFTRFLGELARLADKGIKIYIFKGNHDMWMLDYLSKECQAEIISNELIFKCGQKTFFVAHGDGLGPGDVNYKFLKKIFRNPLTIFLFRYVIPADLGMWLGKTWAAHSWKKHRENNDVYVFNGLENEFLYQFCLENEKHSHFDYYIFGHRHYKFDEAINQNSKYINLGDWIRFFSYAVFDGDTAQLIDFKS